MTNFCRTYKTTPTEIKNAIIQLLKDKKTKTAFLFYDQLSSLLQSDNGTITGSILYLCSMMERAVLITERRTNTPIQAKIELSFIKTTIQFNIYIPKMCFIYMPSEMQDIKQSGARLKINMYLL